MPTTIAADVQVDAVASIDDVPAAAWDALAGADDFYQSHGWLASVERDTTAKPQYLLASRDGRLVGALPVYQVEHEAHPGYHPDRLTALLGAGGGHLVAGARRCYRSEVMLAGGLAPADEDRTTAALVRAALALAAADGLAGIAFFHLPTGALQRLGRAVPVTAAFDGGEAVVEGVGGGIDGYLEHAPSKLRTKVRRERRVFAETGWHLERTPLAECVAEVASLMSQVELRHGNTLPDFLIKRMLRRQIATVGDREAVFTCRDGDGTMVACSVWYAWRDTLYSRAVGLDYERIDGTFAYFNLLLYDAIAHAQANGIDRLHLGLASTAKAERGAVVRPLWTAIVPVGAAEGEPGVDLRGRAAMEQWAEPYRRYAHALPAAAWDEVAFDATA